MKFSIILRAYNAEEHLSKSVESVLRQTYENWELIIVNDGSTDNTGKICEQYARGEKRIKLIYQDNKGCLAATQTGIRHAEGDYVCLIDADDWYDPEYLQKIRRILDAHRVDMVVASYYMLLPNGKRKEFRLTEENKIVDVNEAIKIFLQTTNYALWNKFVARDKIYYLEEEQKHYDTYGKTTNFGDDLYLLMPVLCRCDNVFFTSECLYNYVVDDKSISHKLIKEPCGELIIRNRLMSFTYNVLDRYKYLNDEVERLIRINTVKILMPNILDVLKTKKIERKTLGKLKKDNFYRHIVKKTKVFEIKNELGIKKAIAFWLFNSMI